MYRQQKYHIFYKKKVLFMSFSLLHYKENIWTFELVILFVIIFTTKLNVNAMNKEMYKHF